MLLALAGSYFATGLLYLIWCEALGNGSGPPVPAALLSMSAAIALVVRRFTPNHRLVLDALNVVAFAVFSYVALHQRGIYSSSLWWLAVPVMCSLMWGSFLLGSLLAGLNVVVAGYCYFAGPRSIGSVSYVALEHEQLQLLMSNVLSTSLLVVFIIISVGWLRSVQRRLSEAERAASGALKSKTVFLANVSHEIRTPLNALLGAAELLRSPKTHEAQKAQLLTVLQQSAKMLLALVTDVLDFSKLEAGKLKADPKPVHICKLHFEMAELFSVQAFNKGLDLTCSRTPEVPRYVMCDEKHLRQVLSNFLSNAIKFTEAGGVHMHLSVTPATNGKRCMLRFDVSDTGVGIPLERMEGLFTPYTQVGQRVSDTTCGTGLGLSICKELARLMQGSVTASSVVGMGSVFTVQIPLNSALSGLAEKAVPQRDVRALVASSCEGMQRHMQTVFEDLGLTYLRTIILPHPASVLQVRADVVFVDAPLLWETMDAKEMLEKLEQHGIRVAVLAPLGSDVMVGAAKTTTIIYKPVHRSAVKDFIDAPNPMGLPAPQPEPSSGEKAKPSWLKVLVAEDNPVNQLVVESMLQNLNCSSRLVANGEEALRVLEETDVDVVLMDIDMPVMDGMTATRRLRARETQLRRSRLAVVAMTGASDSEYAASALDAGMDRFLAKPFGLAQLRRELEIASKQEFAA